MTKTCIELNLKSGSFYSFVAYFLFARKYRPWMFQTLRRSESFCFIVSIGQKDITRHLLELRAWMVKFVGGQGTRDHETRNTDCDGPPELCLLEGVSAAATGSWRKRWRCSEVIVVPSSS